MNRHLSHLRPLEFVLWLVVCFGAPPALAMPADRDQPIYLEADRADMDDQKGVSTYRGNVTLTQGSMLLKCDVLVAHHSSETHELVNAQAEGSPAHFRQQSTPTKEEVTATAPRMEYVVDKQLIYLLDNGEVHQGHNVFHGKRIVYNLADAGVHAESGNSPGERVRITLLPHEGGKGPSKPVSTPQSAPIPTVQVSPAASSPTLQDTKP